MMLEFTDCPHCGKRIRVDASRCHKCGFTIHESGRQGIQEGSVSAKRRRPDSPGEDSEDTGSPENAASYGGYDPSNDDFDYEEFLKEEFGNPKKKRNFWYYVAWIVIASLAFPIVLQVLRLFGV